MSVKVKGPIDLRKFLPAQSEIKSLLFKTEIFNLTLNGEVVNPNAAC